MAENRVRRRPRIEDKQPYIRGEIVRAYGDTGSLRQTALAVGVDVHTVERVFARNPEDFATANKMAARNFLIAADICARMSMEPERLARCTSLQLAVMSGIYADKSLAFQDRIKPGGLDIYEIREYLSALRARKAELERALDVTPTKGATQRQRPARATRGIGNQGS
jgi:hypothetical protein